MSGTHPGRPGGESGERQNWTSGGPQPPSDNGGPDNNNSGPSVLEILRAQRAARERAARQEAARRAEAARQAELARQAEEARQQRIAQGQESFLSGLFGDAIDTVSNFGKAFVGMFKPDDPYFEQFNPNLPADQQEKALRFKEGEDRLDYGSVEEILGLYKGKNIDPNISDIGLLRDYMSVAGADKDITAMELENFEIQKEYADLDDMRYVNDTLYAPERILTEQDGLNIPRLIETGLNTLFNTFIAQPIGLLTGKAAFGLGASGNTAFDAAVGTNALVKLFKPIEQTTLTDAAGNKLIETSVFGKKSYYTPEEIAQANQNAIAQADQWASESDSSDISSSIQAGLGTVANATGGAGGSGWEKRYKNATKIDMGNILESTLTGAVNSSDIKSAQFALQVSQGQDIAQAAMNVYGLDKVREILPEGYQDPTESAIRIGMGENRIEVLADVYDVELGVDTPIEQGIVTGLSTYDQTGDANKALYESVKKFRDEGGKLPSVDVVMSGMGSKFGTPDNIKAIEDAIRAGGSWVEDTVKEFISDLPGTPEGLKSIEDFARSVGSTTEDVIRAAGSTTEDVIKDALAKVPDVHTPEAFKTLEDFAKQAGSSLEDVVRAGGKRVEDFVREVIPKIEFETDLFEGMTLDDVGLSMGDLKDLGVSLPDLQGLGFDLDIEIGSLLTLGATAVAEEEEETEKEEEEEVSLEPDEELFDPTRSLAREMLGMEQTKAVQQAERNKKMA